MKITSRVGLVLILLLALLTVMTALASSAMDAGSSTSLSWNIQKDEAPFIQQGSMRADFTGPLVYPSGEFALPLSQTLVFDSRCDCYSLMVKAPTSELELLNLWRTQTGFYRSGSGPYLELTNLDSLKAVKTLSGTRFLFAQVGDGEWRCVSIHDSLGNYLLIDYRADGLIEQIRDSASRTAIPIYSEGRITSLLQSWSTPAGPQKLTTTVR
jgi:hypothetical protein